MGESLAQKLWQAMRTAEEVAEELYQRIINMGYPPKAGEMYQWILSTLSAFAEEQVRENREADDKLILSWKPLAGQARAEALEEAAKVAEDNSDLERSFHGDECDCAEKIRALQTKARE